MRTYWIVVGSPENFKIAVDRGFDLFGFKSTRRRESGEMQPGDKLVFYLTGVKKFGGIATVTSETYEDHKKIFKSEKKPGEDYPFRVTTEPEIILDEERWLHVPDYVPVLEFTKKGQTKNWALSFQGNLHKISEADYKLLESEMRSAQRSKPKAPAKDGSGSKEAGKRAVKSTRRRSASQPAGPKATRARRTASTAKKSTSRGRAKTSSSRKTGSTRAKASGAKKTASRAKSAASRTKTAPRARKK